jgi:hypothetical protein
MSENKHIVTAEEFVSLCCSKIAEFQTELKAIVRDLATAFARTAEEITKDREHIAAANTEILALKARVDILERLVGGLPPRMDA